MAIIIKDESGIQKEKMSFDYFRKTGASKNKPSAKPKNGHNHSSETHILYDSAPPSVKIELFKIVLRADKSEKYMRVLIGDDIVLKFSINKKERFSTQNKPAYAEYLIEESFVRKNRRYFSYPELCKLTGEGIFPLEEVETNSYKIIYPRK